jgi:hypothetical protein
MRFHTLLGADGLSAKASGQHVTMNAACYRYSVKNRTIKRDAE